MAGKTELRRGNMISTTVVSTKLSIQTSLSLELSSFHNTANYNSYTSLRDVLPSTALISPCTSAVSAAGAVAIRNRLVKQAAWAYLQPMSASPSSNGGAQRFLRRIFAVEDAGDSSCVGFIAFHVAMAVDRLLALFRVPAHVR